MFLQLVLVQLNYREGVNPVGKSRILLDHMILDDISYDSRLRICEETVLHVL